MNQFLFWLFFSSGLVSSLFCWLPFSGQWNRASLSGFKKIFWGSSLVMSISGILLSFRDIFQTGDWVSGVILLFLILVIFSGLMSSFTNSKEYSSSPASLGFLSLASTFLFLFYGFVLAYFAIRYQHYFLFLFSFLGISIPLSEWFNWAKIKHPEGLKMRQESELIWAGVAIIMAFLAFGLKPVLSSTGFDLADWIYWVIPILGLIGLKIKKSRISTNPVV